MKLYDIMTKKEYLKDNEKKNFWLKVGTYKETEDGKKFIELNIFPTTSFYIFEQKQKESVKVDTTNDQNSKVAWDE